MKVTVVPAQVTTVEDRIIGNLGFPQILLLVIPVFMSAGLFALLPPFMESTAYKYCVMVAAAFICCVLAVRIKGKILAAWLVTILRYNLRPKYYLFNKNTAALRQDYPPIVESKLPEATHQAKNERRRQPRLSTSETALVLAAITHPAAKFRFETTKKGSLHVRLTEIEE